MKIKVRGDYECPAVWWDESGDPDKIGPIEVGELQLPSKLVSQLDAWADEFTATYHNENPVRFEWPSQKAYRLWLERGAALTVSLQQHLGTLASVRYFHIAELERVRRKPD